MCVDKEELLQEKLIWRIPLISHSYWDRQCNIHNVLFFKHAPYIGWSDLNIAVDVICFEAVLLSAPDPYKFGKWTMRGCWQSLEICDDERSIDL